MGLKETIETMKEQIAAMSQDLEKAARGNHTAAQRVRTDSVQFAKLAKQFRKESIAFEKVRSKQG